MHCLHPLCQASHLVKVMLPGSRPLAQRSPRRHRLQIDASPCHAKSGPSLLSAVPVALTRKVSHDGKGVERRATEIGHRARNAVH